MMYFLMFILYVFARKQNEAIAAAISGNCIEDNGNKATNANKQVDDKIFYIPHTLKIGDEINVNGQMKSDKKSWTISLVLGHDKHKPDFDNIACQVQADFQENRNIINAMINGTAKPPIHDKDLPPNDLFVGTGFNLHFQIKAHNVIDLQFKESSSGESCKLEHNINDIKYLTLGGDIEKVDTLSFLFA